MHIENRELMQEHDHDYIMVTNCICKGYKGRLARWGSGGSGNADNLGLRGSGYSDFRIQTFSIIHYSFIIFFRNWLLIEAFSIYFCFILFILLFIVFFYEGIFIWNLSVFIHFHKETGGPGGVWFPTSPDKGGRWVWKSLILPLIGA